MEFNALRICVLVLYLQAFGYTTGLTLRQLSEKIAVLESSFNFENAQRHKDYEDIISKLSKITTKLDKLEENPSFSEPRVETMEENIKVVGEGKRDSYNSMNDQLQYLINGMKEEKRLNGMIRRQLPRIEREFNEMNDRTKRELSRHDSEIAMTNLASKEHFEKLNHAIKGLVNSNNEKLKSINDFLEMIVVAHDEDMFVLRHALNHTISKNCNVESVKSSMERLWSNISLSFEETSLKSPQFTSCKDAYSRGYKTNGVYTINNHIDGYEIKVYCDQATDGGGWTVFQRRMNGEVDFYRDWPSYKLGFGNLPGEFWLGNDYLSAMLGHGKHELRIDMGDFEGNRAYAKYSSFRIDPEASHYKLHVTGFSGDVGNSLAYHNGQKFSTKDLDLDKSSYNCSEMYKGGWWYGKCHRSNLNGLYHSSSSDDNHDGLIWQDWKGNVYSLKSVEMKFRLI